MTQEKMNIDKLFKDKLEGFSGTPSDAVWSQVNASLAQQGVYQSFWARNRKWAAVLALLIIASGTIWFVSDSPEADDTNIITTQQSIATTTQEDYNSNDENTSIAITEADDEIVESTKETDLADDITEPNDISYGESRNLDVVDVVENIEQETEIIEEVQIAEEPVMEDHITEMTAPEASEISNPVPAEVIPETPEPVNVFHRFDYPLFRMNSNENPWYSLAHSFIEQQQYYKGYRTETNVKQISDLSPWNKFSQKPSYLCVGASAGPEYLFYGDDNSNSGVGYGLDLYYNKSGLILRSGVQLARYGDEGEYNLNYQRVDSLGYMYTVESFTIDPNNPDSVIFNMKIEGVYDSVNVSERRLTDAYYSYLQLPVMVGYTVASAGNLSFDISGGPVFNILIKENNPHPDIPVGDNIYMGEMENQSDPWIKTNIQLRAAVAMHYRFSRHMRLTLEPTYNYYINPVYTGNIDNVYTPYSLGARIGLLYKF